MTKKMDTLIEIAEYINKNWGSFAICTDDYDMALHDILYNFYYKKLQWCGCGDPALALKTVRDYLDAVSVKGYEERCKQFNKSFSVRNVYDNGLLLCLAYALDKAGFTEHGSSIGGAWLTKDGEMFLYCLKRIENIEEYDI